MSFLRPSIIRPPSEWRSYFLPLTAGCSNNTCTFCNYYGSKLHVRKVEEVLAEIDALAAYKQQGVAVAGMPEIVYAIGRGWDGQRVFLQDGDALVYPFLKLKQVLEHLNEKFPRLERVASYATARDILRRTPAELRELRDLKLGIVYMGVESGDEAVLSSIRKGASYQEMVEAGRRVKDAGILLSATVILGLAGVAGSTVHALSAARILTDIDPDYAGALTLTLVPGTPIFDAVQRGELQLVTPFRSLEELKLIVENASFTDCFFSSVHASNYFTVRGRLPKEKAKVVQTLENVLAQRDPSLLRAEYSRGL
ncbi:MAG TPA: radical SAM protein [Spirochaetia bacterium]|nr:radical SAM protein [Spirochaetia bacterium]